MSSLHLYVFPYAGGASAAVADWHELLRPEITVIPVTLPGRDRRYAEPPCTSYAAAVADVREHLFPSLPTTFAFYGHSMGARLAFEVARELRRLAMAEPVHLFVSGSPAPRCAGPKRLTHLSDEVFLSRVRRLGGIPDDCDPELLGLLLPRLRADFAVAEGYKYEQDAPLECPISVWGGQDDSYTKADLQAWRLETSGGFALRMLPGGHFFIRDSLRELLADLRSDVADSLRIRPRAISNPVGASTTPSWS